MDLAITLARAARLVAAFDAFAPALDRLAPSSKGGLRLQAPLRGHM
jgi:hypothetical protein